MSEQYKRRCKCLNYVENLLILPSTGAVSTSISAFASLVCVPARIISSAVGINIFQPLQGLKSINQL